MVKLLLAVAVGVALRIDAGLGAHLPQTRAGAHVTTSRDGEQCPDSVGEADVAERSAVRACRSGWGVRDGPASANPAAMPRPRRVLGVAGRSAVRGRRRGGVGQGAALESAVPG